MTTRHYIGTYLESPFEDTVVSHFRECQWEFVLGSTDKIVYEKAYNKYGQLVWGFVYSPPIKGLPNHAHFVGPDGFPRPQRNTAAEFIKIKYSDQGYQCEISYFDRNHKPQPASDLMFAWLYKLNEKGLSDEITSLDKDGKPMINKAGHAIIMITYDELYNVIGWSFFDISGNPVLYKNGCHKITAKYDERGNMIEMAYFNTAGNPTIDNADKAHKLTDKFNKHGNPIEEAYFGAEGNPTLNKEGYHKSITEFDDRGNPIESAYFDTSGNHIINRKGYHKFTTKFDEHGNPIEWAYFDTSGNPTIHKDGYHKIAPKYNDDGKCVKTIYLNANGEEVITEVVVISVIPNSQAERIRLKVGDVFTNYNGEPVSDVVSFIFHRDAEPQGGLAKELWVLRDGKVISFMISTGEIGVELRDRKKEKGQEE